MSGRLRGQLRAIAGAGLALAALVWVFHDIRPSALAAALRGLRWGWIPVAVLLDLGSYVVQGERWRVLLRPLGRLGLAETAGAVYAALFVNEILPLRPGEFLRAHIVSQRLGSGMLAVVPSMVVERFLEGIWLTIAAAVLVTTLPLPRDLVRAGDILGGVMVVAVAAFLILVLRGKRGVPADAAAIPAPSPRSLAARIAATVQRLLREQLAGVREIGRSRRFWTALVLTAVLFLLQGIGFWTVMLACRIPLSAAAGIAIYFVVFLGTALPNAPGNVGTYQFFCVLGLTLFGLDKTRAAAFSLVAFFVLTVPLWATGYVALKRSGVSLRSLRESLGRK